MEETTNSIEELNLHKKYMRQAITQAKKAYKLREVPIGCVIVHNGKIIGRGYNRMGGRQGYSPA